MDKEKVAIMRLQEASQMSLALYQQPLIVTISGGKDSSVCLELALRAGIPFEISHNHMGIPWELAFALRADGWYLRDDIIWHKTNAMPEAVTDRPTRAHEYIFLFSKGPHYFYDAKAIAEPCGSKGNARSFREGGAYTGGRSFKNGTTVNRDTHGNTDNQEGTRNKRDVWSVATAQFKDAHYATFPPELIRPCVLAGCPPGGIVLDPFFGSGTTGVVALQEERDFIGIELNSAYVSLARKRIESTLEGGVQLKFSNIRKERSP